MPDDSGEEIVVVGRRRSNRPSPEPRLSIETNGSGSGWNDILDRFPPELRRLVIELTDFDVDATFTAKQKEIIIKAIQGIADHPQLAAAFAALAEKGADINILPVTRAGQIPDDALGGVTGLNADRTVQQGAVINIYIRMEYGGEPRTLRQIAETVVHELVHALGVPAFSDRLDAPGSTWDRELRNDIFRGYDFDAPSASSGVEGLIIAPEEGGYLAGTPDFDVFSGSNNADIISPGAGGSSIYSGFGDDQIIIELGGRTDVINDSGGSDRIVLAAGVDPASVTTRWSDDGVDLSIFVNGVLEAVIEAAAGAGAIETVEIGGIPYGTGTFATAVNAAPAEGSRHFDYFGAFHGGYVGSGSTNDVNGDALTYRLGSVSGSYADQNWTVDPRTGAIQGHFFKGDQQGSEFSFLTIIVSDGMITSQVEVTIRWAYSLELDPQLGMFASDLDPIVVYGDDFGLLEATQVEPFVTIPQFG